MAIEETMSQLANSQLNESVPSLEPYLLGFQLIDSDPDKASAIGASIAAIGDTCICIPAILKGGKIYSMDIMYIPAMDQFFPTQDNWISYLRSKKSDMALKSMDHSQPNSYRSGGAGNVRLTLPFNMLAKLASFGDKRPILSLDETQILFKWAGECVGEALLNAVDLNSELNDPSKLGVPAATDCISKCAGRIAGVKMRESIISSTAIGNAFARYYDDSAMAELVEKVGKFAKLTADPKPEKETAPRKQVRIITTTSDEAKDLPDNLKAQLIRDGIVLRDDRGYVPTDVFKQQAAECWTTVNHSGLYELLRVDGTSEVAYVVKGANYNYIIPAGSGKDTIPIEVDASTVLTGKELMPGSLSVAPDGYDVNDLESFRKASLDADRTSYCNSESAADDSERWVDNILAITPNGRAYRMYGRWGNSAWVSKRDAVFGPIKMDCYDISMSTCHVNPHNPKMVVNYIVPLGVTAESRFSGNSWYCPAGTQFYVKHRRDAEDGVKPVEAAFCAYEDMLDACERRQELTGLKIFQTEGVYTLSDPKNEKRDLTKTAAMFSLVNDYFIQPDVAAMMIKEASASRKHSERYLLKIASSSSFSATFDEESPHQFTIDSVQLEPAKGPELTDNESQTIKAAAETGIKEVFDVSVLKVLAGDSSSVRLIQEYIPDLFKAMDRVARILYLCRAGDSLSDAYGVTRANVLEKTLRKLVADIGDLIMFLQQGKIDSFHELLEGELSQSLG